MTLDLTLSENPQTLLVLGGSLYQVPFIEAARRLGVRVVTADNRPGNPGHRLADAYVDCSTVDVEGICRVAQEWRVDGILAAATDVALDAVAAAADRLGLVGPGSACVATLTRKAAFRAYQRQVGLPHPGVFDAPPVAFPVIVKPNRGSGSKGIQVVNELNDWAQAQASAALVSMDGTVVCEEFIAGHQGTVEGLIRQGKVLAMMVTDRLTAKAPHVGTLGHRTPSALPQAIQTALQRQVEKVLGDFNYADGPFDGDYVVAAGVVYLLEITPRVGGNSLAKLWKAAHGFDMPRAAVLEALGIREPIALSPARPAMVRILSVENAGRLEYDKSAVQSLVQDTRVFSLELDYQPGASVEAFADGRHRIGDLTVAANAPADAEAFLVDALTCLGLRARPV
jgi:biotin carboxylase